MLRTYDFIVLNFTGEKMTSLYSYSYVSVKTRAEAVADQVTMFLQYAGIDRTVREKILVGIEGRWLDRVGVYLSRNSKRFLEAEVGVDWELHSNLAKLTPTVHTDLLGWEQGASPEVAAIGLRFGKKARELNLKPNYWVRFMKHIRDDPAKHREYCSFIGVGYQLRPPEWESQPAERAYKIQDLSEVHAALRSSKE